MKKRKQCPGFPLMSDPCNGIPDQSPIWCDECEKKRRAYLSKQFEKLLASYNTREL